MSFQGPKNRGFSEKICTKKVQGTTDVRKSWNEARAICQNLLRSAHKEIDLEKML